MPEKQITRVELEAHPLVARAYNNPNWEFIAKAAVDFLIDGTPCPIASWTRMTIWKQVLYAHSQLQNGAK